MCTVRQSNYSPSIHRKHGALQMIEMLEQYDTRARAILCSHKSNLIYSRADILVLRTRGRMRYYTQYPTDNQPHSKLTERIQISRPEVILTYLHTSEICHRSHKHTTWHEVACGSNKHTTDMSYVLKYDLSHVTAPSPSPTAGDGPRQYNAHPSPRSHK